MRKNIPFSRPTLGLRDDAHQVELIMPNGTTQAVLGTRHPGAEDQRASVAEKSGGPRRAVRQEPPGAIELAVQQRTQTILTHRLPRTVQDRLNGAGVQTRSRMETGTGAEPLIVPGIDD